MHVLSRESVSVRASAAQREALIVKHLVLVHYVARRLGRVATSSAILEHDDLVGYGCEGLIAAIDTFDPRRGTALSTWAVTQIRGAILDRLRELDPVSRCQRDRMKAIEHTRAELADATGNAPADDVVAARLGMSLTAVRTAVETAGRRTVPLDDPLDRSAAADRAPVESLPDEDPACDPVQVVEAAEAALELRQALSALLARLPARERQVVEQHYLHGRLLQDIAADLGVTTARVSQLHTAARRRIQSFVSKEALAHAAHWAA